MHSIFPSLSLILLAVALAGCSASQPDAMTMASPGACNAEPVQALVGKTSTPELVEMARQQSASKLVRVIKPGDAVTMDFNTQRLNLDVDEAGVIKKAACG
ncbi:I78 family peptidase inhibitor [Silvimonas sp.]|uniref:I78 family peptidase inhibitor n=1 Tax=Silvimonas sp. TaxID=2650811 RepID=UPI0028430067|nr:I78 family peptidase inhibitor [Silvimonas sp.]MDR3427353.1 I78 family peptidase inhibitor [Silvimonas sp.]